MSAFFEDAAQLRAWFETNHGKRTQLKLTFRTRPNGHALVAWDDAIDVALCFGWTDVRRLTIDAQVFAVVFGPRGNAALWHADHLARAARLIAADLMSPPGIAAYEGRNVSRPVASPMAKATQLDAPLMAAFYRSPSALAAFERLPPSQREKWSHWVLSAKQPLTRARRLEKLILDLGRKP